MVVVSCSKDTAEVILKMVGEFVIVRAHFAGVHCGTLVKQDGAAVVLKDARRIWRWRGANTLNELATKGAAMDYTRISEPVEEILLCETCETIKASDVARENLTQSRWGS
jgi:hypothetical protein